MAYSMTGYGRGEISSACYKFTVEMRSVNHRFCDISIRIPRKFSALEDRIRQLALQKLSRGKIDIYVNCDELGEREREVKVDMGLAAAYFEAAEALSARLNLGNDISLSALMRLPDIFQISEAEQDEGEAWEHLGQAARLALDALINMRSLEGNKLMGDISGRLGTLSSLISLIEARAPFIICDYREKLIIKINELLAPGAPDDNRIAAEIAAIADKCGIDEEITRFKSHITQAAQCCAADAPVGRKFDFILQEINREVNTIGSKANDLIVSETIVNMKSEVEKIREQIQNLE